MARVDEWNEALARCKSDFDASHPDDGLFLDGIGVHVDDGSTVKVELRVDNFGALAGLEAAVQGLVSSIRNVEDLSGTDVYVKISGFQYFDRVPS